MITIENVLHVRNASGEFVPVMGAVGGGGDTAWTTICEGTIPEAVSSIVINADADGTPLNQLDINEFVMMGSIMLSGNSKLRFEYNGLWTAGNYISTNSYGTWRSTFAVHSKRFNGGVSTEISIGSEKHILFTPNVGEFISAFEIHVETSGVTFSVGTNATSSTNVNAYYR